ncbi:myocardin-related transcription factor B isoform X2 [Ambystoma mexicanum]|uniref:myocardin-related transcription factor B isoform X2 n=1 Tax=Ambystoma mexicanum TaxID=8296 RepID=UPI0037E989E4
MIDSCKKQQQEQQSFQDLIPAEDFEAMMKDKECLDLNSQKTLKEVLQLRLQQRRTREQLVDQGIMPPLKSPAAFHEQIKSLERARTENFLKHKIRSRPERSELVRMHILEETFAEPSLQATQMKLKRARLADDLNEKIAQRPGPMELVEKNILPVDSTVKEAITDGEEEFPENHDTNSFDEDSSDALSPDQPASQESQSSAASPAEAKPSELSPIQNTIIQPQRVPSPIPEFFKPVPVADHQISRPAITNAVSPAKPTPTLVKQSQPKNPNEKHRSKKSKEPKPRVKKLKYHQYIPPDQKCEKIEPEMDSNYARLLQQQQLFLQLQILSQQQQHYNYQTILPAPLKTLNDKLNGNVNTTQSVLSNNTNAVINNANKQNNMPLRKPGPLPSNLDDMKVAELKMELKLRGLTVSGTKTDLIERLKPYQEINNNTVTHNNNINTATTSALTLNNAGEITLSVPMTTSLVNSVTSFSAEVPSAGTGSSPRHMEKIGSPLPMSPTPSEQSSQGTDDTNMTDTFTEIMTMMSPSQFISTSPFRVNINEDSLSITGGSSVSMDLDSAEKDRKLQEKERQIEELKRKLEQEQKLVEVLKMQLEVEKRSQQQKLSSISVVHMDQSPFNIIVKDEKSMTDCSNSKQLMSPASQSLGQSAVSANGQNIVAKKAVVIKQEAPVNNSEQQKIIPQFYLSPQRQTQAAVVTQPQALLTTQAAQLLLPVSIHATNATTSMQPSVVNARPNPGIQTQAKISSSPSSTGPEQTTASRAQSPPSLQDTFTQHMLGQSQQMRKVFPSTTSNSVFSYQSQPIASLPQTFMSTLSKNTLPMRTNQATTAQNGPTHGHEVSNAHSQQMDDLFDILIKSGEISPLVKEEPSPISKMRPVTASITTMPVSTVVTRPPPRVQMAPVLTSPLTLESTNSLSLSLENQIEAFLDGTLSSGNDIPHMTSNADVQESFSLIEDLQNELLEHSALLDHSHSPMETSDPPFVVNGSCLSLDLPDTNLDNMEWLDITMPNSASSLTPLSATVPNMFSSDFLDPQDLQLHWD